jgi:TfuA protein
MPHGLKLRIHSGLSVSSVEASEMLEHAEICGPIQRGDIAQAIRDGVHVVGIIDGAFQHARAVSPSELMDALRSGMRVYGSSSVGALRAVELERYGMIGVGAVFALAKQTFGFRDDFVATTSVEEEGAVRGVGLPFAAFFLNARRLVASGELSGSAAGDLCERYARLHFTQRNETVFERALRAIAPSGHGLAEAMKRVFAAGNPLRDDGLALLSRIDTDLRQVEAQNQRIASLQQGDRAGPWPMGVVRADRR